MDDYSFQNTIQELISKISFEDETWKIDSIKVEEPIEDLIVEHLYLKYKRISDDKINEYKGKNYLTNEPIEHFFLNKLQFNSNRFWFVDELMESEKGLWIEKDSNKILIEHGDYYYGGETKINDDESKKFVYLNTRKKGISKNSEESDNYTISIASDKEFFIRQKPIIRYYFHLKAIKDGVLEWSNFLANKLDERNIPFQLKYNENRKNYIYKDAGVLYVSQNHFNIVKDIIEEVGVIFKDILRKDTPIFTKRLADGIGFAEDPYFADKSFGKQRALLITQILMRDEIKKLSNDKTQLSKAIVKNLSEKGYNTKEFYRNPNTNYKYDFDYINSNSRIKQLNTPFWGIHERKKYLEVAINYAKNLCEKAIYLDDKYTWITFDATFDSTSEKAVDGHFRLVNNEEKSYIQYFLQYLSLFVENKQYYQGFCSDIKINIKVELDKFKLITTIKKNIFSIYNNENRTTNHIKNVLKNWGKNDSFEEIESNDSMIIADYLIENFENTGLQLRNGFGTYDFCPTQNGITSLGLFFLALYSPRIGTNWITLINSKRQSNYGANT
ncbi:MAG: T3SS effector HopA1 family protein [Flavobacterium sp.]|jgi:hypothetical protein|nr:T3SS effector HopA1 family protein [Flavobacterium sp.]